MSTPPPACLPQSLTIGGTALSLLPNGPDRLAAILALIDGAKESLKLLFYIFATDAAAIKIRDALTAAALRGVRVTVLLDSFGSATTPHSFFTDFHAAGGTVRWFGTRWTPRYLIRNHQKLLIADDCRCLSGGFNVANGYFADADDAKGWCDIGVLLDGAAVAGAVRWFDSLADWMAQPRPRFRDLRRLVRRWRDDGSDGLQWLVGGPTARLSPMARAIRTAIRPARRLSIVMAYFTPDAATLRSIARVASRGGETSLLLPARSDNPATVGASRLLYGYLLKRDVAIAEYQRQMLHAKLIVIDDMVLIGSANFDLRSLYINMELVLRVDSAAFADQCLALMAQWQADAEPITPALHRQRAGWWSRLRWSLAWLVVGLLDYGVTRRLNFGLEDDPAHIV
jgi:cardiolipin synthase A/B